MSDNVVLVAPRPRRVGPFVSSQRQIAHIVSPPLEAVPRKANTVEEDPSEKDSAPSSGRNTASPRINLSPDALEEFLSILRPSLFTPSSPGIRRFGSGPTAFPYDRSQPFKPRDASQNKRASISSVEGDFPAIESSPSPGFDHLSPEADQFSAKAWRMPGLLESPVSRTHTRNPFYRHPSYETSLQGVVATHLSPTLLPLPPSPPQTPSHEEIKV
ncbi:hypothetical protein SCHPADRAFT_903475 [Schizopora paradoxa]|uniref:Uncharacterized protein n=1 Tax=Schizopora paradoxa TaxID=27342 RepID=A0A0H2RXF8_9AGAM|nr:hypothetical protein SCHPADRAFT_903475 [Schizopora paradoxa]